MFQIFKSAINGALTWIFQTIVLKFGIFGILYFITNELLTYISDLLPGTSQISNLLLSLPSDVWYYLNLANFSVGLSLIFLAFATRFIIRRFPLIG